MKGQGTLRLHPPFETSKWVTMSLERGTRYCPLAPGAGPLGNVVSHAREWQKRFAPRAFGDGLSGILPGCPHATGRGGRATPDASLRTQVDELAHCIEARRSHGAIA